MTATVTATVTVTATTADDEGKTDLVLRPAARRRLPHLAPPAAIADP